MRHRLSIVRNALFGFLRFIEHHVSGFHGPVLAFLLIGLLGASAVAVFAFWGARGHAWHYAGVR